MRRAKKLEGFSAAGVLLALVARGGHESVLAQVPIRQQIEPAPMQTIQPGVAKNSVIHLAAAILQQKAPVVQPTPQQKGVPAPQKATPGGGSRVVTGIDFIVSSGRHTRDVSGVDFVVSQGRATRDVGGVDFLVTAGRATRDVVGMDFLVTAGRATREVSGVDFLVGQGRATRDVSGVDFLVTGGEAAPR